MTEKKKTGMSIRDHLVELLRRLRVVLYAVAISTLVVMLVPVTLDFSAVDVFYPTITSFAIANLQEQFLPVEAELLPLSFLAPLEVYVFVSVILGVVISLPVIAYELYKFLNPALHQHERKAAMRFVAAFAGLFIFGFALGYLFVLPATMRMLFLFSHLLSLPPVYDFGAFFSLVGFTLLLCGMIFTFPLYIVLLVQAGILETGYITRNRKYLYGALFIVIAVVDPEPSLVTESLMFVPLVVLTEVSLLVAKRIEKARLAQETD